jgi:ankyrin repeat protein
MDDMLRQAAAGVITEHAVVGAWIDEKPSEGKRAARVYLAAQLQATCMHPAMTSRRGVEMLERAIDACPEAAKIPERTTGRTALLLLCDRDDIKADQLQVLAKIILSAYPPASSIQVRVKGAHGYRYDTNPIHEVCERDDATPALLDVLLDGVNEETLGQKDSRDRTPLHALLANPSVRVHEVPASVVLSMEDGSGPASNSGRAPGLVDASARKAALDRREGWLLAFMLGAEGGTNPDRPRLAMQDEHQLTPLHTLLRNNHVSAPFLAPAIRLLKSAMDFENSSRRSNQNSFTLRDERNYGVLHTLCERRDFIVNAATHDAVEFLEAIVGQPDLSTVGISMNGVRERGITSHPACTVEDGSRPQGYLPLHYLVKSGSQMPADRLAKLLVPMALAHREAVCIKDVADFDRCALHVIADRRDVDSHMLKALVQACPEAAITKDNRGCTPLHSLLENVMLSHAYTRQQKVVAELKDAIVERDAAIPLQSLLRRWLVRGAPPAPLDPTTAERLQKKQTGVDALRPWLEPLVVAGCNCADVAELAKLKAAAAAAEDGSGTDPPVDSATVPTAPPDAAVVMAAAAGATATGAKRVPTAFLRWQDVESTLVELADPGKLRDAAKLVAAQERAHDTSEARARTLLELTVEVGFDAIHLVRDALSTGDALRSLAIATLQPRMAGLCKVDENNYLADMDVEDDLDWEVDAVPAMRLMMDMKQKRIDDPDMWGDEESESGSGSEDDWGEDSSEEGSEPETLDQLLTKAMLQLHEAEAEAEHMVKWLVDADARDENNKKVDITMEENEARQIPLRALLNNVFVAHPVMARLLGFLTAKNKKSGIQPGAKPPHRTPLLLMCADKEDITAEMVGAIVQVCPDAASVTDAYNFDAMRITIERQHELRLGASLLSAILAKLAVACPDSVVRREVPSMDDAANSKNNAKLIGKRCGRSPVHMICERDDVTPEMIDALVSQNDQAYVLQDDLGRTPLHTLCENPYVNGHLVRSLLKTGRAAACMVDAQGLTPLQSVCKSNPGCSVEVLQLLAFVYPDAAGLPDERGQTAAHLLSMRTDITGQHLEQMLQVVARAAHNELILQDHAESASALHYLCRREDVTPQMLSTILRSNARVASKQDRRRRTALHWLCMDPKNSASTSDATEDLISVFVGDNLDLPVLTPLPKMPELDLRPEAAISEDDPEAAPEPESEPEAEAEREDEPEPEHDMEYGPYAIVDALELADLNGRTALHYMCRRDDMEPLRLEPLIAALAAAKPATVYAQECAMDRNARSFKQGVYNPDRTPLHEILRRSATFRENVGGGLTEELLSVLFNADSSVEHRSNCGEAVDFFGRTCFHVVCSRQDLAPQLREELLTVIVQAAPAALLILDDFSEGALHTLCDYYDTADDPKNTVASITTSMVSLILEANPQILDLVDVDGMSAFMHLCDNPYVTPALVEAWVRVKPSDATEVPRRLSGDHAARLRAIYLATDLDGDGELTPDELAEGIHQDGELARLLNLEDSSPENIDDLFDAMDGNQNGLIDMAEFVNFFESEPVVQAAPRPAGKSGPKHKQNKTVQDSTNAEEALDARAASMRRTSTLDNDVVVAEEDFLLPEELAMRSAAESQATRFSADQDTEDEEGPRGPQDRTAYSDSWRAVRAVAHKERVDLEGRSAPASCQMQLVVRRSKAQDRWKMKGAGGVKGFLAKARGSAMASTMTEVDYPYLATVDAVHGRTALHWLCMNESIEGADMIAILVAVSKLTRSTISRLTVTSPLVTPLHLVVTRNDVHENMVRPLVRFNKEAAAVRDELGWLPIQLVYTKPGFASRLAAETLDLLAAAYPDGCRQPAPTALIKNRCSLHIVCGMKDVCVESIRAVITHCPTAGGLRDEHTMVPLHYLCKNTGICMSFRALEERLPRTKERVKTATFSLVHLLLTKFSAELCRFVYLNHPGSDPDAAEQHRQRWEDTWRTRELPPELLTPITRDPTGGLAESWRDWVCQVMDPLAARLVKVCSQCPPQANIPGPVFKMHFPHVRGMRPNWSSFEGDVLAYMKELQQLASGWRAHGAEFAAKQPTQVPNAYYGYVHAAGRAAAYYAKPARETANFLASNEGAAVPLLTKQHRAKYSAVADAVQYPSLSAWPAEKHVQFGKSGEQSAFGHGRAAVVSKASRDGHGSVAQQLDVSRKVESIMRKGRRKPRRASGKLKKQQAAVEQRVPVFQLTEDDLQEPTDDDEHPRNEGAKDELAIAESTFAASITEQEELESLIARALKSCEQMIEELSNADPTAAKMTNRYGRTPTHYLALNRAIPAIFLPAMLRSLLKCDPSVLFIHALATIDTVVKSEPTRLQNQRHRSPLHCVVERHDLTPDMVKVCVEPPGEKTAAKEVDYWGNTPLQTMLLRRDLEDDVIVDVAKILAKASPSSLGIVNTAGLTALHMLIESTLSADAMTRLLSLLCASYPEAVALQEHSDSDLGHVGPMTDSQRAAFSFKPNDRLDVWVDEQWWEATVTSYTPQGLSRPWRIEFKYVDGGARGAFMLDDDHDCVRRAHYRVGDLVDVDENGQWRQAEVTAYTPQLERDPWRVEFAYLDTPDSNVTGALLLDDDFEKIRIHQPESSIASVRSAAWALRAAAKVSNQRRQRQSEMRHSRLTRRKLHGTTQRTVLHLVCTRTDVTPAMVKAVLRGPSSNNPCATTQDADGCTALHRLCSQHSATLETILAYMTGISANDGARAVTARDSAGSTPLHRLCAANGDAAKLPAMITALVSASTDPVETTDELQCTPLHYLVNRPDITPAMTDALIGPIPDATTIQDTIGRTPLHKLAAAKHLTMPLLLSLLPPPSTPERGDPSRDDVSARLACAQDAEGRTALHMICRRRPDFDVDEQQGFPTLDLSEAVRAIAVHCDEEATVAQERVRLGESQDREQDRTALHDACHRDDVSAELVESLLMKYPAIGTCYDIHGCTALHVLMEREKVRGPPPNPNLKEVPLQAWQLAALIHAYTSACKYAPVAHISAEEAELLRQERRMAGVSEDLGWVAPEGLTGFEAAELKSRRTSGWTPLHELALRKDLTVEMIEAMGEHRKLAGTIQNHGGRTPLHTLLSRPDLFGLKDLEDVIDAIAFCNEEAVGTRDRFDLGLGRGSVDDRTPLHYMCARNDLHDPAVLRAVFARNPKAAMVTDRNGRLPVHLLLRRDTPLMRKDGQPAGLLAAMVGIAQESISYRCTYFRGATALHLLAQRPDCNIALLQMMLLGGNDDSGECILSPAAAAAAVTKTTAIETPTALRKANPNIEAPFSDKHGGEQGEGGDDAGWTPLHVLCVNPVVSPRAVHMLASAVPAAAKVSDKIGRLPIHLLLENAHGASNSELTEMLRTLARVQPTSVKTQDRVHKRTHALVGTARGPDGQRASQARAAQRDAEAMLHKLNWLNRTPLHVAAARPGVTVEMLRAMLEVCPTAAKVLDVLGRTPLHRLVLNPSVTRPLLECAIRYGDGALMQQNHWGRTPLASLAFNHSVSPDDLADMMGYVAQQYPPAMLTKDFEVLPAKKKGDPPLTRQDRTPLLVLCERPDVTTTMLEKVLEVEPQAALMPDGYGATPTLTLSRRKDISTATSLKLRAVVKKYIDKATRG